jgi:hypothetical protein
MRAGRAGRPERRPALRLAFTANGAFPTEALVQSIDLTVNSNLPSRAGLFIAPATAFLPETLSSSVSTAFFVPPMTKVKRPTQPRIRTTTTASRIQGHLRFLGACGAGAP